MPLIGTAEEARANRRGRQFSSMPGELNSGTVMRSDLIPPVGESGDPLPNCKLIEQEPHTVIRAHFHIVNQFQVVVAGEGTFGRFVGRPISVQYSGAYTGYGPITASAKGLHYMVFRSGIDHEARYMPESRDRLRGAPRHKMAGPVAPFTSDGSGNPLMLAERTVLEREADGMAASLIWLPPNSNFTGSAPLGGGGQFHYIVSGTACFNGQELKDGAVVHIGTDEGPANFIAGASGTELLFMQFPRQTAQRP
jgi:hypothetical protein